MKKRLSTYFSLFAILSSFLVTPVSVFAETTNNANITQETKESTSSQIESTEKTKESASSQNESTENEEKTLESTQTDQRQSSEIIQSTDQQNRAPSRVKRAAQNSVITSLTITDKDGTPLNHDVSQFEQFKINLVFNLPNGKVFKEDTTKIALPNELSFANTQNFEIKDSTGNIVANASVSPDPKQIVLTYTDYVENHSDIKGQFYFYVAVDTSTVKEKRKVSTSIDVEGKVFPIDFGFGGIEGNAEPVTKSGWFKKGSDKELHYFVAVNRDKKSYPNVVLKDKIKNLAVKYINDSFKIIKGQWQRNADGTDWELVNPADVTAKYPVTLSEDNSSFSINFGDIGHQDQFAIYYDAELSYTPSNGENISNTATLISNQTVIHDSTINTKYQKGGGNADGDTFSIKIHKENENKESLSGAEFDVIRNSTGTTAGKLVSDANGNASLEKLLKDNYTIVETKAPEGYELSSEKIKITPSDFGADRAVLKTIVNKKKEEPKINISGSKTWNDADNQDGKRPDKITITLFADGGKVGTKDVTAAEDWKYEFTNLPKFKEGKEIVYTITENQVTDYSTEVKGFDLINNYTPGKTSVSVTKRWEDANNQDGKRPNSIKVQLLADGKAKGEVVELNAANKWTTTWNNLPQKAKGKDIVYTIEEDKVAGYTTTVDTTDKGNIVLTNTHTPESPNKPDEPKRPSKHLPKTGEQVNMGLTILGLVILLVIGGLYLYKKRTESR